MAPCSKNVLWGGFGAEGLEEGVELGGDALELFAVHGGEGGEFVFATGGQGEADLAVIDGVGGAAEIFFAYEAVGEADDAMMFNLEPLGEFADGDVITAGEAFDGQKGLVLLRGESGGVGGIFTKAEELPEGVTEFSQMFVMGARELIAGLHAGDFLAQDRPDDKPNRLEIYRNAI